MYAVDVYAAVRQFVFVEGRSRRTGGAGLAAEWANTSLGFEWLGGTAHVHGG